MSSFISRLKIPLLKTSAEQHQRLFLTGRLKSLVKCCRATQLPPQEHLKSVRFWLFFPTVHTQTTAVPVVTTRVNGTVTVSSSHSQSLHWERTSETFQLSTISSFADSCCPSARLFVSSAAVGSDVLSLGALGWKVSWSQSAAVIIPKELSGIFGLWGRLLAVFLLRVLLW